MLYLNIHPEFNQFLPLLPRWSKTPIVSLLDWYNSLFTSLPALVLVFLETIPTVVTHVILFIGNLIISSLCTDYWVGFQFFPELRHTLAYKALYGPVPSTNLTSSPIMLPLFPCTLYQPLCCLLHTSSALTWGPLHWPFPIYIKG